MPQPLRPGVLIVEDEEELLSLVVRVFESESFRIFRAKNGLDAVDLFSKNQAGIDLVISDLGLPGMSGPDLITAIRTMKPSVKIISVSGYGSGNVRSLAKKAGADMFCEKPFVMSEFLKSVRKLLETP